jgi:hypothetical protein
MRKVAGTSPDAVLLAGLTEQNGGRLIKDKVAAMGPNGGAVKLLAPDGFAQQSTIDLAGAAAKGMFASVPGRVPQNLAGPGRRWSPSCRRRSRARSSCTRPTRARRRACCSTRSPAARSAPA